VTSRRYRGDAAFACGLRLTTCETGSGRRSPGALRRTLGHNRLLHAAADDTVQVILNPLIVNRDDIAQRTRYSLSRRGSLVSQNSSNRI
jgi:hypothetical protein